MTRTLKLRDEPRATQLRVSTGRRTRSDQIFDGFDQAFDWVKVVSLSGEEWAWTSPASFFDKASVTSQCKKKENNVDISEDGVPVICLSQEARQYNRLSARISSGWFSRFIETYKMSLRQMGYQEVAIDSSIHLSGAPSDRLCLSYNGGIKLTHERLCFNFKLDSFFRQEWRLIFGLLFVAVVLAGLTLFWFRRTLGSVFSSISSLSEKIVSIGSVNDSATFEWTTPDPEFGRIGAELKRLHQVVKSSQSERAALAEARSRIELVREVAHDLQSPLFSVQAIVSGLISNSNEQREVLSTVVSRLKNFSEEILRSGSKNVDRLRRDTSGVPIRDVPVLLDSLIREKQVEYQSTFRWTPEIQVSIDPSMMKSDAVIRADSFKLVRIFSNLINNSIENASLKRVDIQIDINGSISLQDGCCIFTVRDSLKQLSTQQREVRETFAKPQYGIGLQSAEAWIKSWGGNIRFEKLYGSDQAEVCVTMSLELIK